MIVDIPKQVSAINHYYNEFFRDCDMLFSCAIGNGGAEHFSYEHARKISAEREEIALARGITWSK